MCARMCETHVLAHVMCAHVTNTCADRMCGRMCDLRIGKSLGGLVVFWCSVFRVLGWDFKGSVAGKLSNVRPANMCLHACAQRGQSGRARHASRAISRDACRVVAPGFPKGRRRDWMAFWVPEEFSDVFWGHCAGHVPRSFAGVSKRAGDMIGCYVFIGLVHSMSCVFGCLEKFGCGANMEAVLPFWWPVLVVRWLFQLR